DARRAELRAAIAPVEEKMKPLREVVDPVDERVHELEAEWKKNSVLGRVGRAVEPAVRPLGWGWRVGGAALASFPGREVVVGTLGIVYKLGKVDTEDIRESEDAGGTELGKAMRAATWDGDRGRRVFTVPVALSLLVFFALCCQCASTLAIIKRETNS